MAFLFIYILSWILAIIPSLQRNGRRGSAVPASVYYNAERARHIFADAQRLLNEASRYTEDSFTEAEGQHAVHLAAIASTQLQAVRVALEQVDLLASNRASQGSSVAKRSNDLNGLNKRIDELKISVPRPVSPAPAEPPPAVSAPAISAPAVPAPAVPALAGAEKKAQLEAAAKKIEKRIWKAIQSIIPNTLCQIQRTQIDLQGQPISIQENHDCYQELQKLHKAVVLKATQTLATAYTSMRVMLDGRLKEGQTLMREADALVNRTSDTKMAMEAPHLALKSICLDDNPADKMLDQSQRYLTSARQAFRTAELSSFIYDSLFADTGEALQPPSREYATQIRKMDAGISTLSTRCRQLYDETLGISALSKEVKKVASQIKDAARPCQISCLDPAVAVSISSVVLAASDAAQKALQIVAATYNGDISAVKNFARQAADAANIAHHSALACQQSDIRRGLQMVWNVMGLLVGPARQDPTDPQRLHDAAGDIRKFSKLPKVIDTASEFTQSHDPDAIRGYSAICRYISAPNDRCNNRDVASIVASMVRCPVEGTTVAIGLEKSFKHIEQMQRFILLFGNDVKNLIRGFLKRPRDDISLQDRVRTVITEPGYPSELLGATFLGAETFSGSLTAFPLLCDILTDGMCEAVGTKAGDTDVKVKAADAFMQGILLALKAIPASCPRTVQPEAGGLFLVVSSEELVKETPFIEFDLMRSLANLQPPHATFLIETLLSHLASIDATAELNPQNVVEIPTANQKQDIEGIRTACSTLSPLCLDFEKLNWDSEKFLDAIRDNISKMDDINEKVNAANMGCNTASYAEQIAHFANAIAQAAPSAELQTAISKDIPSDVRDEVDVQKAVVEAIRAVDTVHRDSALNLLSVAGKLREFSGDIMETIGLVLKKERLNWKKFSSSKTFWRSIRKIGKRGTIVTETLANASMSLIHASHSSLEGDYEGSDKRLEEAAEILQVVRSNIDESLGLRTAVSLIGEAEEGRTNICARITSFIDFTTYYPDVQLIKHYFRRLGSISNFISPHNSEPNSTQGSSKILKDVHQTMLRRKDFSQRVPPEVAFTSLGKVAAARRKTGKIFEVASAYVKAESAKPNYLTGLRGVYGENIEFSFTHQLVTAHYAMFTPGQWLLIRKYFKKVRRTAIIEDRRISFRLRDLQPSIFKNHWVGAFITNVLSPIRRSVRCYTPDGTAWDTTVRTFNQLIVRIGRHINGVTALMLVMKLRGDSDAFAKSFFSSPDSVSRDIRRKGLARIIGNQYTKILVRESFLRMKSLPPGSDGRACLQASAANVVVGFLRVGETPSFFHKANISRTVKLENLYEFLADVEESGSDLDLNAARVGMIYGALLAYCSDVELQNSDNFFKLQTGLSVGTSVLQAAATAGGAAIGGPAGTTLGDTMNVVKELVTTLVDNKKIKLQQKTQRFAEDVINSFGRTVAQNAKAAFIPGYYQALTDGDRNQYVVSASDVFQRVSQFVLSAVPAPGTAPS